MPLRKRNGLEVTSYAKAKRSKRFEEFERMTMGGAAPAQQQQPPPLLQSGQAPATASTARRDEDTSAAGSRAAASTGAPTPRYLDGEASARVLGIQVGAQPQFVEDPLVSLLLNAASASPEALVARLRREALSHGYLEWQAESFVQQRLLELSNRVASERAQLQRLWSSHEARMHALSTAQAIVSYGRTGPAGASDGLSGGMPAMTSIGTSASASTAAASGGGAHGSAAHDDSTLSTSSSARTGAPQSVSGASVANATGALDAALGQALNNLATQLRAADAELEAATSGPTSALDTASHHGATGVTPNAAMAAAAAASASLMPLGRVVAARSLPTPAGGPSDIDADEASSRNGGSDSDGNDGDSEGDHDYDDEGASQAGNGPADDESDERQGRGRTRAVKRPRGAVAPTGAPHGAAGQMTGPQLPARPPLTAVPMPYSQRPMASSVAWPVAPGGVVMSHTASIGSPRNAPLLDDLASRALNYSLGSAAAPTEAVAAGSVGHSSYMPSGSGLSSMQMLAGSDVYAARRMMPAGSSVPATVGRASHGVRMMHGSYSDAMAMTNGHDMHGESSGPFSLRGVPQTLQSPTSHPLGRSMTLGGMGSSGLMIRTSAPGGGLSSGYAGDLDMMSTANSPFAMSHPMVSGSNSSYLGSAPSSRLMGYPGAVAPPSPGAVHDDARVVAGALQSLGRPPLDS